MLEAGFDRPSGPSQEAGDDLLQPSTSEADVIPADRYCIPPCAIHTACVWFQALYDVAFGCLFGFTECTSA